MRSGGRWPWVLLLLMGIGGGASAQDRREITAGGARVAALDVECWSNSQVPCDDLGRVELSIRTGRRAVEVRVVRVEVLVGDGWRAAEDLHLRLRSEGAGAAERRPRGAVARARARAADVLSVFFSPIPALDGARTRVTVEVGGRRATLHGRYSVVTESPDPEL